MHAATFFLAALVVLSVLAGLILGYGLGYRRRPLRRRPIPPEAIAERLAAPPPTSTTRAVLVKDDAPPVRLRGGA